MRLDVRGRYPDDWPEISRRVRDEAGNRCVRCGHPEGDKVVAGIKSYARCDSSCTHPRDWKLRALTVHHLDGDKANVRWWNLLALCQACHLHVQSIVVVERPWLFDHSPWFVPYVCGFYAHYYGELEITRAEALADPERWLQMGQPWRAAQ